MHPLANVTLPSADPFESIGRSLVVQHGLVDLLLAVQNKRTVLHHLLVKRLTGDEENARVGCSVVGNGNLDIVPILLKNNIVEFLDQLGRVVGSKHRGAAQDVRKRIPALRQRLRDLPPGLDVDIEDPDRGVCEVPNRVDTMRLARDDLDGDTAIVNVGGGDLTGVQVAVPGLAQLQLRRQVHPQLHPHVGATVGVLVRHLRVHDALARGHELQIPGSNGALVSGEILMVHAAGKQVCDGLLAAVRVVRETGAFADGEMVEHEEWAEVAEFHGANGAAHAGTGAFALFNGQEGLADCTGDSHFVDGANDGGGFGNGGGGGGIQGVQVLRQGSWHLLLKVRD